MTDIRAGDVVVCVDVEPDPGWALDLSDPQYVVRYLTKGEAYRVRRVAFIDDYAMLDVGVPSPPDDDGFTGFWPHHRFRKIEAPKTELSERIRKCQPIRIGADA